MLSSLSVEPRGGGQVGPRPGAGGDGDSEEIDRDDVFHMLRNRRRRYALHHLKRAAGPVEIGELAEQVAAWENGTGVDTVSSRQRKRAYNSLQQTHLPELADNGVISYDSNRGVIELDDRAQRLDIYLEVVPGREIPWSEYYLALGVVSTALIVAAYANVFPLVIVPDIGWGVFVTTAFVISAIANLWLQRGSKLGDAEAPPEVRRRDGGEES